MQHTRRYIVKYIDDTDGGIIAEIPALPGCVTWGEDLNEAREMIADAAAGYIAVLIHDGRDVPEDVDETVLIDMSGTETATLEKVVIPNLTPEMAFA